MNFLDIGSGPTIYFINRTPKVDMSKVTVEFNMSHRSEVRKIICTLRNKHVDVNIINTDCKFFTILVCDHS